MKRYFNLSSEVSVGPFLYTVSFKILCIEIMTMRASSLVTQIRLYFFFRSSFPDTNKTSQKHYFLSHNHFFNSYFFMFHPFLYISKLRTSPITISNFKFLHFQFYKLSNHSSIIHYFMFIYIILLYI